ncbi:MAG TPA: hypothetical protein VGQ93_00880, partial [Lysobacter sp.]|nr:hypothetical protein [Lysobacter sp.]
AAIYFVLALFGCDGGGTTIVTHSSVNGVDQIYSKTQVKAGIARFECIRSASGRCHYTLFPKDCPLTHGPAGKSAGCKAQPADQFVLVAGDSREVVGLPSPFDLCVSTNAESRKPDCTRPTQ